ncbi:MAG: SIS domain-containing protein [Desulfobacteraceae bacterium]|jgi:phosphoheptose isomerase
MPETFKLSHYFDQITRTTNEFTKSKELQEVIDLLYQTWETGGTVFVMGCGGSASTATHFAADLAKTTNVEGKRRFKAMALVDNIPLVSAWTNDNGWGTVFREQLEPWLTPGDVLVGFSVHGGGGSGEAGPWSQNLVAAMELAQERKAKIIGFSGFDGGAMKKMADTCMVVPVTDTTYGTPVVEGYHCVLTHAIIFALKDLIKNSKS